MSDGIDSLVEFLSISYKKDELWSEIQIIILIFFSSIYNIK